MINVLLVSLLYLILFGSLELIKNRFKLNTEITRKVAHILSGISSALLPFILSFTEIAILACIFIVVMFVSKKGNIFSAIHGVKRQTYGEVYFPLAILVSAVFFPSQLIYTYGLLVMGVSDGLASIFGQAFKSKGFSLFNHHKTYAGSGAFFVSAALIGCGLISFFYVLSPIAFVAMISLAAILTVVEALAPKGLDNLLLPIAANCMLVALFAVLPR